MTRKLLFAALLGTSLNLGAQQVDSADKIDEVVIGVTVQPRKRSSQGQIQP